MPFIILQVWRSESETLPSAEPVRSDWACSELWPCYPSTPNPPTNPALFSLSGCLMTDQDSFISLPTKWAGKGELLQDLSKQASRRGNNWQQQQDFHGEIDDGAERGLISKLLGGNEELWGQGTRGNSGLNEWEEEVEMHPIKLLSVWKWFVFWHVGQLRARWNSTLEFFIVFKICNYKYLNSERHTRASTGVLGRESNSQCMPVISTQKHGSIIL